MIVLENSRNCYFRNSTQRYLFITVILWHVPIYGNSFNFFLPFTISPLPFLASSYVNATALVYAALIVARLIFTGLHDQGVESEFQWSDGSAVQFTNWDGWNPDNWRNSEDCANVRNYNDGRWNDQNCYSSLPYICKKPKGVHQVQYSYFKRTKT